MASNQKFVFISDHQAPFHLPQAVALSCAFIKDYKPDLVVLGGDIIDFCTISKFTKVGRFMPTTVVQEIETCEEEVLKPTRAAAPRARMVWIEGNHEFRLTRYIAAMAKPLEGLINLEDALGCKRNNIEYVASKGGNGIFSPFSNPSFRKNLTFMHGKLLGPNPAKNQYGKWGASMVMGHAHKESTYRDKQGCGSDHVALAAGCLCKDPDWDDVDNYTRGFVAGWINQGTGEFGMDHVRISGDQHTQIYSPWGEYYATRKQKIGPANSGQREYWTAKRLK